MFLRQLATLLWVSKILLPKVPRLQSFIFMEACPQFPLSVYNDFASSTVQQHILDHWEQDKVPAALREAIFTPQISWKKIGKQWKSSAMAPATGSDLER